MTEETKQFILEEFETGNGSVEHYDEIRILLKTQGTTVTRDEIKEVHKEFLEAKYPNREEDIAAAHAAIEAEI
ncbi:hypothetical protein HN682_08105 [Candidatus Peregrinibacteria bacterium]|jgi:hypothetical protein|nr:hypothetical protein [Candidatus Peregrinibacteria bacterium]